MMQNSAKQPPNHPRSQSRLAASATVKLDDKRGTPLYISSALKHTGEQIDRHRCVARSGQGCLFGTSATPDMLCGSIIRQLVAAQQLQLFSNVGAAAAIAASGKGNCLAPSANCSVHSSAQHQSESTTSSQVADHSGVSGRPYPKQHRGKQHDVWEPQQDVRSLPPPSTYGLRITIKAHDLINVKMASTAIRDLAMVNLAPKSKEVLPYLLRKERTGAPWVNLAMPIGDRAMPIKRTHFTVISGPHVHKTAREQFTRTTHTRVVQVGTNNLAEFNWLLHSIKMYKFVGVELTMRISSSSYLLPTSTSQQDAAQQPLLAAHKQRFAHLFGATAPSPDTAASTSSSSSSSGGSGPSFAALQQSLQGLQSDLHKGLLQQRMQLAASDRFQRWQNTAEGQKAAAAAAGATSASKLPQQQLQDAVAQQLEGSAMVVGIEAGGSKQTASSSEQALVGAVEKLLGGLETEGLDRHKYFPYFMAFYQPGKHQLSPAEWMQAVLLYGKHRQAQVESEQQPAAAKAYAQYGKATKAALLLLLQQWHKAADGASRAQLAMPSAEQVEQLK